MTNGETNFRISTLKDLFCQRKQGNVLSLIVSTLLLIVMLSGCGGGNKLLVDETLVTGQSLQSANGSYTLNLQSDGNLVLKNADDLALWSTDTQGTAATRLILQGDGNLVMYTNSDTPVWASNTVGSGATELRLHDTGALVLYQGSNPIWSVNDSFDGGGGTVNASTLDNKIMAGYQGWFMASGDGSGAGWRHWASNTPNANNITFDMWPDLREYDSDELFTTSFHYSDGSNAGLYSAYTPKTVDRHVKWMKDYGIDGVFVQRFIGEAIYMTSVRDRVLNNIRRSAETHGRVFANMYDISGGNEDTLVEDIKNDWMHLVDDLKITQSSRYLRHNGKPVLSIWGFGFADRPGSASQAAEIIRWLTIEAPEKYRVTLKGGIDPGWRGHSSAWRSVYRSFDIISPWAVGRYGSDSGADNFRETKIEPDLASLAGSDIDYMPVVFPGFSWSNLKDGATLNQIPRRGGRFFWRQVYNAIDAGSNMIYVAMFDEVDEGTAMFKIAENSSQTPSTGRFLTLDADGEALPSDWYLRLMGEASKMLRGERPLSASRPINP